MLPFLHCILYWIQMFVDFLLSLVVPFFFLFIIIYLFNQLSKALGPLFVSLFDLAFPVLFLYWYSTRNSFATESLLSRQEQAAQGVLGLINLQQEVSIGLPGLLVLVSSILVFSFYYYDRKRFPVSEAPIEAYDLQADLQAIFAVTATVVFILIIVLLSL